MRSDCKPLTSIFGPKKGIPTVTAGRLQRYTIFLSKYHFKIEYVTSNKNSVNVLSRLLVNTASNEKSEVSYLNWINEVKIINADLGQWETVKDKVLSKIR